MVIVSLIGFWDWRSALLMGLWRFRLRSMTFGMVGHAGHRSAAGIDRHADHCAGLAGGRPVVAGDAIKNAAGAGLAALIAAWLGPTRLIKAIIFATITNIVAYLPFLTLTGDTGEFLYSSADRA